MIRFVVSDGPLLTGRVREGRGEAVRAFVADLPCPDRGFVVPRVGRFADAVFFAGFDEVDRRDWAESFDFCGRAGVDCVEPVDRGKVPGIVGRTGFA